MIAFFRPKSPIRFVDRLAFAIITHEDFTGNYWSHMIEHMLNKGFYCQNYVSEISSKNVLMIFKPV